MAGYVTKLQGHVYDGAHTAAEPLKNGVFAEITAAGTVKLTTAAKDMKMRVHEKTALWGLPAVVLDVVSVGADEVYYVENESPNHYEVEWNDVDNTLPVGQHVRMKRLLPGEQVIMTVDDALFGALAVGNVVTPAAGGTVAVAV